jgi:GNAT superfamily N-acetyltransferase
MLNPATYSAIETLRDGCKLTIRAYSPLDREIFLSAVDRMSPQSRYLRFFTVKRDFTDRERSFFLNVDFEKHVAIVALIEEARRTIIAGGGRYVTTREKTAELAFVVIDEYQGRGIGSILLRHLVLIARATGLRTLVAEVLPENAPMLRVFGKCGLPLTIDRDSETVHVTLQLN